MSSKEETFAIANRQYLDFMGSAPYGTVDTIVSMLDSEFGNTAWSMKGYLHYLFSAYHDKARFSNVQKSPKCIHEYRMDSSNKCEVLPLMLKSTLERFKSMAAQEGPDKLQRCCEHIAASGNPLVLYLLFRGLSLQLPGTFMDSFAESNKTRAKELLELYPEVKDGFEEPYKALLEELSDLAD